MKNESAKDSGHYPVEVQDKGNKACAPKTLSNDNRTGRVQTDKTANRLAQINPKSNSRHWSAPFPFDHGDHNKGRRRKGRAIP